MLTLEPPSRDDFDDPKYEGQRLFSELLGTFFLVLVASGTTVVNAVTHGRVSGSAQAIAPGLMVIAIIYFMGDVGGAHLNPAVTIAFALRRNFPWRRVPGYVVMQLAGGVLAAAFLRAVFGDVAHLGATSPAPGFGVTTALVLEVVLTLGLMSVILGTASGGRNVGPNAALAVGAYIGLAGLWAAPITGASMNPGRSFGPALVGGHWTAFWVYVVGPILGSSAAVAVAWALRGPPTQAGARKAQGSLPSKRRRSPAKGRSASRKH